MKSLRSLVRAILLEDDETLKKWALADGDPVEKALAAKGIVPIHRGQEQTSKLGEGMHNVVLDVVYQGKRAVARLSSEENELNSLLDFVEQKRYLPTKYHKHFPVIHKTFDIEVETEYDIEYYYGAVVEMLDPLPPGLEFDLDYQNIKSNVQRARVAALTKDDWVIEGIIYDASMNHQIIKKDLLNLYELDIRPHLMSWVNKPFEQFDDWLMKLINKRTAGMTAQASKPYYIFNRGLIAALKGAVIPHEPTKERGANRMPDNHASKHVREFYEFLQELEGVGMKWADLHTGNFMVRRGTGDFVIVDPGYFDSNNSSGSGSGGDDSYDPPSGS